jgi:metal-responsive CopG/Arc/MetJ family transcriptional regulator
MKTIAISIDEELLDQVDDIARARRSSHRGRRPRARRPNRSEVIRDAVRAFVRREQRGRQESQERRALSAHRARLARQLEALVGEQAQG